MKIHHTTTHKTHIKILERKIWYEKSKKNSFFFGSSLKLSKMVLNMRYIYMERDISKYYFPQTIIFHTKTTLFLIVIKKEKNIFSSLSNFSLQEKIETSLFFFSEQLFFLNLSLFFVEEGQNRSHKRQATKKVRIFFFSFCSLLSSSCRVFFPFFKKFLFFIFLNKTPTDFQGSSETHLTDL